MTTMAAKLKGQGAQVIRPLTAEIKAIREAARGRNPLTAFMQGLYLTVRDMIVSETYTTTEMRKLLDVCINEADKELKEIHRRRKALAKEAAKLAKKDSGQAGMTKKKEAAHGNGNSK